MEPLSPQRIAVDKDRPWPGLQSYGESDQDYYRGRERDAKGLFRLVRRETLSVLYGASGLGKTSILQAGLFPRLRKQLHFPISVRLNFDENRDSSLGQQVKDRIAKEIQDGNHRVDAPLPTEEETLWEYFHRAQYWDANVRLLTPVLIIDQFEEIFTLGQNDERVEPFLTELADLIENRIPARERDRFEDFDLELPFSIEKKHFKVILSLREDYLAQLDDLRPLIPSLSHNRFHLNPLTGHQGLEAVLGPGGHLLDRPEALEILRLAISAPPFPKDETEQYKVLERLEVEPAILNLFCFELNRKRLGPPKQDRISAKLVRSARGKIMSNFYEDSVADLEPRVRLFIEDHLLNEDGYRTAADVKVAEREGIPKGVLSDLVDRRLLRFEPRFGRLHVELIHDVLRGVVRSSRDMRREREEARAAREAQRLRAVAANRRSRIIGVVTLLLLAAAAAVGWRINRDREVALEGQVRAETAESEARIAAKAARQAEGAAVFAQAQLQTSLAAESEQTAAAQEAKARAQQETNRAKRAEITLRAERIKTGLALGRAEEAEKRAQEEIERAEQLLFYMLFNLGDELLHLREEMAGWMGPAPRPGSESSPIAEIEVILRRASERAFDSSQDPLIRALAHARVGDVENDPVVAIESYYQALGLLDETEPTHQALELRAQVLRQLTEQQFAAGRLEEAGDTYSQALELFGDLAEAGLRDVEILDEFAGDPGGFEGAVAKLESALTVEVSAEQLEEDGAVQYLADLRRETRADLVEALAHFDAFLERGPDLLRRLGRDQEISELQAIRWEIRPLIARYEVESVAGGFRGELDAFTATWSRQADFALIGDWISALSTSGLESYEVEIPPETPLLLVLGLCGEDCEDLDLSISRDGDLLDLDGRTDRFPSLMVQQPAEGAYQVEASLLSCRRESCEFGVAFFAVPQHLAGDFGEFEALQARNGSLASGESTTFQLEGLEAGLTYSIGAGCPKGCVGLELTVRDTSGEEVATGSGDKQLELGLEGLSSASITAEVSLGECDSESCHFVLALMGSRGQASPMQQSSVDSDWRRPSLGGTGYTLEGDLGAGEVQEIVLESLDPSMHQMFLGSCEDCQNVDLFITDATGMVLGQDILEDSIPQVSILAGFDGPLTARIEMVNCPEPKCRFSVDIEARSSDTQAMQAAAPEDDLPIEYFEGALRQGERATLPLPSLEGEITLVGVCDPACSELSLRVLNEHGELAYRDGSANDSPRLSLPLGKGETFVLDIVMVACSDEPCGYYVQVFEERY